MNTLTTKHGQKLACSTVCLAEESAEFPSQIPPINLSAPQIILPNNIKIHQSHPKPPQPQLKRPLEFIFFSPKSIQCLPRFPANTYPSKVHLISASTRFPISISCTKNNCFSDAELALELAAEVEKVNSQTVKREEALNKSRELLFKELCTYMGLEAEEVKKKWRKMSEDDKWVLVKGFVSEWGAHFHPLSARSVKGLVDEYLVEDNHIQGGSAAMLLPSLKKLMGFSKNNNG